ncbi:MAG: hypothetical protein VYA51_13760 [Planctomycetota bacterium]|nr:hypothetical protein [Planctomycetota bacterium]MEC9049072.1 hypothetical protein [Planctomycetota bacterium]
MRLPLLCATALFFAAPAHADRFWLTDPEDAAKAAPGSSPAVIEGVLLADEGGYYQIRVVGGELRVPKAAVFKVESDAQTLETLAAAEAAGQQQRAQDDRERRERQRSRRAGRGRAPRARVAEASFSRPEAPARSFDPVLGVSSTDNGSLQRMQEAKRAFAQTRDRRYLKLLRRLRRMR